MATLILLLLMTFLSALIYFAVRRAYDAWQKVQAKSRRAQTCAHRETQMHWFYNDILSHKQS